MAGRRLLRSDPDSHELKVKIIAAVPRTKKPNRLFRPPLVSPGRSRQNNGIIFLGAPAELIFNLLYRLASSPSIRSCIHALELDAFVAQSADLPHQTDPGTAQGKRAVEGGESRTPHYSVVLHWRDR